MNILEATRKILETAQYFTSSMGEEDRLYFEDSSLFGFVWVPVDIEVMIREWERGQDSFLTDHEKQLRHIKEKSWNAYTVLLCEAVPSIGQRNALSKIEENFRGSRKLVGTGLRVNSQVVQALYPLLRIQNLVVLQDTDPVARLRGRLGSLPSVVFDALLGNIPSREIVRLLRAHEDSSDKA
jgi:hypothetical protein